MRLAGDCDADADVDADDDDEDDDDTVRSGVCTCVAGRSQWVPAFSCGHQGNLSSVVKPTWGSDLLV